MNSTSTQFVASRRMGLYEPMHQMGMWGDFKGTGCLNASAATILQVEAKLDNQSEDTSQGTYGPPSGKYDQEASKPIDKVLRRLAQNREAARKSRLRKKAYVQQLENSKLRLMQLEQELERARQQGAYVGSGLDISQISSSGIGHSGNTAFGIEYGNWVEERNRRINDLKNALDSNISDGELHLLVDGAMNHYYDLFRLKALAAKSDVFYLLSGMWKTSVERLFLWMGGFRPSELLQIIMTPINPLTDEQLLHIYNLRQSCQQAEDALTQGMEKLHQYLGEAVLAGQLGQGNYLPQMEAAMEKLEALVRFVNQADHLRQETLQQMCRVLSTRQAAHVLLVLGEYFQRLRTLSSYWAEHRTREPV
ncbi:hypothetical protein M9H77_19814 [Catharanthus roseus]|uniref:Uncharacterized protein n=1 Tax=Catharanthus roseus TaxID=4058 RepID=A0ACC0BBD5_CATRO|nr:hypothetical protein M9H77_19814 [Catharanthus roseus]